MYTQAYQEALQNPSIEASKIILPVLHRRYNFKSLIDFGCGLGQWSAGLKGIDSSYLGVDLRYDRLLIKESQFIEHDLNLPIDLKKRFDIALCVEVAEHLKPESANIIVDTLVRHSNIIVFSASIPFGGNPTHINEQYWEYWIEKFEQKGYIVNDWLRDYIWDNPLSASCYKTDMLIFEKCGQNELVQDFQPKIHPEFYGCKTGFLFNNKNF